MKTPMICILAALLTGLCVGAVSASEIIGALDTDKDNLISKEEAKVVPDLFAQFEALDLNKDGSLDNTEIAPFEMKQ